MHICGGIVVLISHNLAAEISPILPAKAASDRVIASAFSAGDMFARSARVVST